MHILPTTFYRKCSWSIVCLNSKLLCFVLRRVDNLSTIAFHILKDVIHLSPAEEPDGDSLSRRVVMALTPSEHQLNFLRNEYPKVSFFYLIAPFLYRFTFFVSLQRHDI